MTVRGSSASEVAVVSVGLAVEASEALPEASTVFSALSEPSFADLAAEGVGEPSFLATSLPAMSGEGFGESDWPGLARAADSAAPSGSLGEAVTSRPRALPSALYRSASAMVWTAEFSRSLKEVNISLRRGVRGTGRILSRDDDVEGRRRAREETKRPDTRVKVGEGGGRGERKVDGEKEGEWRGGDACRALSL
jgi:hypothetical protein